MAKKSRSTTKAAEATAAPGQSPLNPPAAGFGDDDATVLGIPALGDAADAERAAEQAPTAELDVLKPGAPMRNETVKFDTVGPRTTEFDTVLAAGGKTDPGEERTTLFTAAMPEPKAAPAARKPEPAPPAVKVNKPAEAPKNTAPKAPAPKPAAPQKAEEKSTGAFGVDIAMRWRGDMHSARFFARPTTVTLGPDGTFPLPPDVMGNRNSQVLIEPHATAQFGLRIDNPAMKGHVLVGGEAHDLDAVRAGSVAGLKGPVLPLTQHTQAVVLFDDFTFIVSRAAVPPPPPLSLWDRENWLLLLCFLMSIALLVGPLEYSLNSASYRNKAKLSYTEQLDERLHELELVEVKIEEDKKPTEADEKKDDSKKPEAPAMEPQRAPEKKPDPLQEKLKNLTDEQRKEKREEIVKEAINKNTAEVDKALENLGAPLPGTKLFQLADEGSAANPNGANDTGLLADPNGLHGGDLAGGRRAGVGDGTETRATGVDALGKDVAAGSKKVDLGAMKPKEQVVVRVGGSVGDAEGELPKPVIKAYIATKMGAIKACYQKGLQANPELSGKVKVAFLIQPNGAVLGARVDDSSLNTTSVEECILSNVKTWKFPQAKGGGSTKVVYPFSFTSH